MVRTKFIPAKKPRLHAAAVPVAAAAAAVKAPKPSKAPGAAQMLSMDHRLRALAKKAKGKSGAGSNRRYRPSANALKVRF